MARKNKLDNETAFEKHFCHQLDIKGGKQYRLRVGSEITIDKNLCIYFEDVEEFLTATQSANFRKLKEQIGYAWRETFAEHFRQALQQKRLFEILKDGIEIQGISLDLVYFYPERASNHAQDKLAEQNRFTAVRQYYFGAAAEAQNKSIDIVILLNGFAIVTIELKNEGTSGTADTAVKQYLERPLELPIFQQPFLHLAVGNEFAKMATHFNQPPGEKDFRHFNKDLVNIAPNPKEYPVHYLYHEILLPGSLLNYIEHYLYTKGEERKWIFPRFHQQRATRRVVHDLKQHFAAEGILDRRYLIQHSAGSGKSNTIVWMAQNLRNAYVGEEKLFHSIIILTDRINLDTQIAKDFRQAILTEGVAVYAENTEDLRKALHENKKVIVSTIHKFSHLKELSDQTAKRVCIIIDEAHRSQSGDLHDAVTGTFDGEAAERSTDQQEQLMADIKRKHLPNMAFIALTATPSPDALENFGQESKEKNDKGKATHEAFDVYSTEQAIQEGYIMDVAKNIYAYDTLYKLDKQINSKKEYQPLHVRKALHQKAYENDDIIQDKCRMILRIFQKESAHKLNSQAKAMIVTSSRLAAVKYKHYLDAIALEQGLEYKSLIAFSGSISFQEKEHTENSLNKSLNPKNEKIERIFEQHDKIRFLIVANKFQTGYDEPLLHSMFIDKPLRGRNAVQTISRLNRIHPDKEDTLAVDFTGSYKQIMAAFKYYQKTVTTDKSADPKVLFELKTALLKFGIFTLTEVDLLVKAVNINDERLAPEIAGLLFSVKQKWEQNLDEEQQTQFKTLMNRFVASFNYIKTIYRIPQQELWDMQIFLIHLQHKFSGTSNNEGLKREVAAVNVVNYAIPELEIKTVDDDGGKGSGGSSESPTLNPRKTVVEVIEEINVKFAAIVGNEGVNVISDYLEVVSQKEDFKIIIANNQNMSSEQIYQKIMREELQRLLQNFVMDGVIENRYKAELYGKIVNDKIAPSINRMAYNLIRAEV